jgi:broad specificity phosphatase PhoE
MDSHSVTFLARHGQTEWNVSGRRQGQLDSPLTDDGRASAAAVGSLLADAGVDQIFSSPLGRARETAAIIARTLGCDIQIVHELAEVNHGSVAGHTDAEIESLHGEYWTGRRANLYDWRFPDGESFREADTRAARALSLVAASGAVRPLMVSHEMTGRLLRGRLLGLPPADAVRLSHPHGVVFRVEDGVATKLSIRR